MLVVTLSPLGNRGPGGYPRAVAKRKYLIFEVEDGKKVPKLAVRSWSFVVVLGILLTLISIVDRGGLAVLPGSGTCSFTVNTAPLNVRAEPSVTAPQVAQLTQGAQVGATNIVTGGFRKLADGQWALDQYLTPVPGSSCV
jgi:hypothetical protein